ncbi:hypothetical protein HYW44_02845 [Candidatus Daviesbacteria bacterium]|nr:hypothetical protein [Candidatus Daviesbacteria bacterium]
MNKSVKKEIITGFLGIIFAFLSLQILINSADAQFLYYCLNIGIQPPNVIYTPSPECAGSWRNTLFLGKAASLIGLVLFSAIWYVILKYIMRKFIK